MEKQTTEFGKHCKRLLTPLLAAVVFCTAEFLSAEQVSVQKMHIFPQQKYCFTNTDCQFNLRLDNIPPETVQSYVDAIPDMASFISLRKDELAGDEASPGARGTMIQVWFQFKKAGVYNLGNLMVDISGKLYKVPFDQITVYENPETVQPQLSISFFNQAFPNNGGTITCTAGDHIRFTLYTRYAVQIINFDWDIPENSIFKEVKQYAITEEIPRGGSFSPAAVPVATFDWQPLLQGTWKFPSIRITATAYNGAKVDLTLPEFAVNVLPAPAVRRNAKTGQSAFAYAFAEPVEKSSVQDSTSGISPNQERLLALRSIERHSFPFNAAVKERQQIEEQEGLASGENEPSVPLFVTLLTLCVIALAGTVLLFLFKHMRSGSVCLAVLILLLICSILSGVQVTSKYALFAGGTVSPIPENAASSSVIMPAGSRVQVQRDTGDWVYIKYNDTYGWVLKTKLYYIK